MDIAFLKHIAYTCVSNAQIDRLNHHWLLAREEARELDDIDVMEEADKRLNQLKDLKYERLKRSAQFDLWVDLENLQKQNLELVSDDQ